MHVGMDKGTLQTAARGFYFRLHRYKVKVSRRKEEIKKKKNSSCSRNSLALSLLTTFKSLVMLHVLFNVKVFQAQKNFWIFIKFFFFWSWKPGMKTHLKGTQKLIQLERRIARGIITKENFTKSDTIQPDVKNLFLLRKIYFFKVNLE